MVAMSKNVLGMSSNRNMALDTFRQVAYTIEDNQFLKDQVRQIRLANGQESISLLNGARITASSTRRSSVERFHPTFPCPPSTITTVACSATARSAQKSEPPDGRRHQRVR